VGQMFFNFLSIKLPVAVGDALEGCPKALLFLLVTTSTYGNYHMKSIFSALIAGQAQLSFCSLNFADEKVIKNLN